MTQPPGFVNPNHPHYVCKLQKVIYGLKQAPRSWFQCISSFLIQSRFLQSQSNNSFTFHRGSVILMLLLYVDDIVLTGNSPTLIKSFITTLGLEVELKDLGKLHYFIGIEVSYLSTGVCLTQTNTL